MFVDVELSPREEVPSWLVYATPLFTVLAALGVSAIALVALGVNPIEAYQIMFLDTLLSEFGVQETLIEAVPLILAGLAVYLPLRANLWNIGAEGQLLLGAVAGTWVGLNVSLPSVLLIPLMFVAAAVAGGVWAGIPALLKAKWDINEIITTLLLTFVASNILSYLVRGPMQSTTGNFPQTEVFSSAAQLPILPALDVHSGLLVAIVAIIGLYVWLSRTRFGFEISFIGSNPAAAQQAGMSKTKVYLFVLVAGGVLAAFSGLSEIAGNQSRLRAAFDPGYGFTAIPIALLGRNSAINVGIAAVFFAVLFVGGDSVSIVLGVPAALIEIIQALIILFLITAEFFKRYSVNISVETRLDGTGAEPTGGER
jgi:simple sugar transport system permease protein